ncbi:MAG: heavy-metal-associated domain-containing protein [Acidobacteria bacterium]|nr:heavy-metal-associated domain-containing protein [Acidobacteriota bacterium]
MTTRNLWVVFPAAALGGALLLSGCGGGGAGKVPVQTTTASRAAEAATVTKTFAVSGMTCSGCEAAIRGSVKKLRGVTKAEASYTKGQATVAYDPKKVSEEEIEMAIERAGYRVVGEVAAAGDTGAHAGTKERP